MDYIFISHSNEDARVALEMAILLEQEGFSTWNYHTDSVPGLSYLIQTGKAIEESKVVLLIISPNSIQSFQVSKEVVRAHESCKHIIPVLLEISHAKFQELQPEWREALGAATSIQVPSGKLNVIIPRIIKGLQILGVPQTKVPDEKRIELINQQFLELGESPGYSTSHEDAFTESAITLIVCEAGQEEKIMKFDANNHSQIVIGRNPENEVHLDTALASRNHALIFFEPNSGWAIEDCGSANGTFLERRSENGTILDRGRITKKSHIKPYHVIIIGTTEIHVRGDIK